jgi:hypothetical protein
LQDPERRATATNNQHKPHALPTTRIWKKTPRSALCRKINEIFRDINTCAAKRNTGGRCDREAERSAATWLQGRERAGSRPESYKILTTRETPSKSHAPCADPHPKYPAGAQNPILGLIFAEFLAFFGRSKNHKQINSEASQYLKNRARGRPRPQFGIILDDFWHPFPINFLIFSQSGKTLFLNNSIVL